MLIRKKEEQKHKIKLIINDGTNTKVLVGESLGMVGYINYLIREGASKVEVTLPITCKLNLKKTFQGE